MFKTIPNGRRALIIPVHNEAQSLPSVLRRIPAIINEVVVVDNGSSDGSAEIAARMGATVVREEQLGYGQACLAGIAYLADNPPELIAFADGDGSDNHPCLEQLITTLLDGDLDLVLAQRIPQNRDALSLQQRFGNALATFLIRLCWGGSYQDLGPMRVIRWSALKRLEMKDRNFGWTVEMQIKALQHGLRIKELPITYLPRLAGESKISRTVNGVVQAGTKILWVVGREAWFNRRYLAARLLRRNNQALASNASSGANQT